MDCATDSRTMIGSSMICSSVPVKVSTLVFAAFFKNSGSMESGILLDIAMLGSCIGHVVFK